MPTVIPGGGMVEKIQADEFLYRDIVADESISKYDVLFFDGDRVKRANATDSSRMPCIGMAEVAASLGEVLDIVHKGAIENDNWNWTIGQTLFVDTVNGAMTTDPPDSAGNLVQEIGRTLSATRIVFDPDERYFTVG